MYVYLGRREYFVYCKHKLYAMIVSPSWEDQKKNSWCRLLKYPAEESRCNLCFHTYPPSFIYIRLITDNGHTEVTLKSD